MHERVIKKGLQPLSRCVLSPKYMPNCHSGLTVHIFGRSFQNKYKKGKTTESGTNAPLAFPFNSTGAPGSGRGVSPAKLIVSWDQRQHKSQLKAQMFNIKIQVNKSRI